ncbi:MAG: hypothetical protein E7632_13580 [Ruminococcaceae bacterium]|nr:hypothetical protein [Oscillospiraceae bacterium]
MKLVTLTLNPAFDIHCEIGRFLPERENLIAAERRDIGGKGINISRALCENGIANCALVVLGDENADTFRRGMDAVGLIDRRELTIPGRIRENITIHPDSGSETRISFKGFSADASLLSRTLSLIAPDSDTLVTFTGSLPGGVPASAAEEFLASLKRAGVRIVIDSKSIPLDLLRRLRPWLIKPNAEEIEAYLGVRGEEELIRAAASLHGYGIENALISLGGDGAILACGEGIFRARPPKIDAVSTIGAGDSMIAGFIAVNGDAPARLRRAIAYGSAACLREGTNPPLAADIARIEAQVEITRLG